MKRILLAFAFLLAGAINAQAQSTTVSGTVTDAGSQVWAGGTYKFTFQPNPAFPTGPYTWTGGALNTVISGVLDGSGHYSVSIPSNSAISPVNSKWILQVTPNATSASFSTPATTITGGTQTLNVTPPAILIPWTNPPGPAISAYADAEIGGGLPKGAEYFNTTTNLTRVWNGTTWANQGGGGGGGTCPAGVAGLIQYTNGTNCASDASLTHNAATLSTTVLGNGTSSVSTFAADAGGLFGLTVDAGAGQVTLAANDIAGRILDFESTGGTDINSSGNVSLNGVTGVSVQVGNASPITPGSVTQRSVTGTTDTILNTDRQNRIVYNSASAVAVTLAQAGTSGFDGGFNTRVSNQNTGVVTITPTVSTINGNATLVLLEGQDCLLTPSSTGTNYAADCNEPQLTAGTNMIFTRGVHSLTLGTSLTPSFTSLTCGVLNTTSCVITGFGSTSGSATITWPAVAGTVTNALTFSNGITSGGSLQAAFNVQAGSTSNITWGSRVIMKSAADGILELLATSGNFNRIQLGGTTSSFPSLQANGASMQAELADSSGQTGWSAKTYSTETNCGAVGTAANPSLVACGSAAAGAFSCATAASTGTCVVAETGVTANSEISVWQVVDEGTRLGVTCNTGSILPTGPLLISKTASTGFTIQLGTVVTNPGCFDYMVFN